MNRWRADGGADDEEPAGITRIDPDDPTFRVLLIAAYYSPYNGGVERYVESLALQLRRDTAWSLTVVTSTGGCERNEMSESVEGGVHIYRLPITGRISNTPVGISWLRRLRRIIRDERPSLINAHAPVPGLADLAARVAGSVPFVLTYHAGPMRKEDRILDALVRTYERMVLPGTLRRANAIITASHSICDAFPRWAQRKASTVNPGIIPELFAPAPELRPDGVPNALFVSSLDEVAHYKNLPLLLRAARHMLDAGVPVTVTVTGDGDARERYQRMALDLGLGDLVRFTGRVDEQGLIRTYQGASFFVLPTAFDSFPTVLCEAMSCALPVVSTTVGGIPELVTDGEDGLLVAPGDVDGLVDAMTKLALDEELRARFGAAARSNVVSRLAWSSQARRTLAVYGRALSPQESVGLVER